MAIILLLKMTFMDIYSNNDYYINDMTLYVRIVVIVLNFIISLHTLIFACQIKVKYARQ